MTVYQCDRCTVAWRLGSDTFETALTFAIDRNGRYLDPVTLDSLPLN
jgi:hypothetical protein